MKNKMIWTLQLLLLTTLLSGCGAWQYLKDTTKEVGNSLLYTQLKTLKLDLVARAGVNQDEKGGSLSVVVRIYQLRDGKTFRGASYEQLLTDDKAVLGDEMISRQDVVISPGATLSLTEPFDEHAGQLAVVALFRTQDKDTIWRVSLAKETLDNDIPAKLELQDNQILITSLPHPPKQPAAAEPQTPAAPASAAAASRPVAGSKGS